MADDLNTNENNKRPLEDDLAIAAEESGNYVDYSSMQLGLIMFYRR